MPSDDAPDPNEDAPGQNDPTPNPGAAAYCPACEHLLADADVVKIIGRHMDGIDPTFRCPACDGEVTHPSRAPDDAGTYDSGRDDSRHDRGEHASAPFDDGGATTVVDGVPPLDVRDVRAGDRITVHYDAPGRAARQTAAGTVEAADAGIAFETDTRRSRRLDPATGVLSRPDGTLGRATRVRVTR